MYQGYRASDPVITIVQDNARHVVEIRDVNESVTTLLGHEPGFMIGKPLGDFLPRRIRTLIQEYVEFEDDGNDVGTVLSRALEFGLIGRGGKELLVRVKVLRSEALDRNAHFRLILQNNTPDRQEEAFRALLRENYKGHEVLDPGTGLPDSHTMNKNVEVVHYYVGKEALRASVAIMVVDRMEEIRKNHGDAQGFAILKHIATLAKNNLRGDDCVGCAGQHSLGIILLDSIGESTRMVLNRLRWLVAANPYTDAAEKAVPLTVSICFSNIRAEESVKDLFAEMYSYLEGLSSEGNVLVQMGV